MADQNAVKIAIARETTFGTRETSGTDVYRFMRFTSEGFQTDGNSVESQEIDADRVAQGSTRVSRNASGSLNCELSLQPPDDAGADQNQGYDLLIEGAMHNDWGSIVDNAAVSLTIGTVTSDSASLTGTGCATGVVDGQWLRIDGMAQGTIYAYVTDRVDADTMTCTLTRDTGEAVVAAGPTSATIRGSMIRTGTQDVSYTVEKQYPAISEYGIAEGMRIGQLDFGITSEAIITMAFTFLGQIMQTEGSSIAGTPTPKWSTPRLNSTSNIPLRWEGGFGAANCRGSVGTGADRITDLSFSVNNQLSTEPEIGEGLTGPGDISVGNPRISGSLGVYMASRTLINKAENDTLSKLSFYISEATVVGDQDAKVGWMISFPAVRFRPAASAPANSSSSPLILTLPWDAESANVAGATAGGTTNVAIQIDRFEAS